MKTAMSSLLSVSKMKWTKTCIILGGCAVAGLSAYSFYSYYQNKNRMIDEGFEDISVIEEPVKKVLILGLDGAGKSTFLSQLAKLGDGCITQENKIDLSVVSLLCKNGKTLSFSEIGGSEDVRAYWSNFVQDTDLLIYIIDSTDNHRLAESVKELRILTACETLKNVPIIVLANKQDLKNSASPENIAAAIGIAELSRHNKIAVYPLEMPPGVDDCNKSVIKVKEIVSNLCFGK